MTHSVRTLLLAAVVFMATQATPPTVGGEGQGPGVQVTRFVCVHCTQTGLLSSCGLFLSRSAVNRHIAHAKPCRNAGMGYREMPIQIPDPGGGRHGRGRGWSGTGAVDPSSRTRYIHRNTKIRSMYTNFQSVSYPVFGVCTHAVQR